MTIEEHPLAELVCQDLVELLTDYLEGACDVATVQSLEAHLDGCPDCREYVAQFRSTIEQVGHVALETLSAATQQGLVEAFREFRQAPRSTSP